MQANIEITHLLRLSRLQVCLLLLLLPTERLAHHTVAINTPQGVHSLYIFAKYRTNGIKVGMLLPWGSDRWLIVSNLAGWGVQNSKTTIYLRAVGLKGLIPHTSGSGRTRKINTICCIHLRACSPAREKSRRRRHVTQNSTNSLPPSSQPARHTTKHEFWDYFPEFHQIYRHYLQCTGVFHLWDRR